MDKIKDTTMIDHCKSEINKLGAAVDGEDIKTTSTRQSFEFELKKAKRSKGVAKVQFKPKVQT
ncbi:hypothetical protein PAXINDRAFT_20897 [Paxillus involutus ATCC 200175]|uniref:Uncharacterized protein n=1 Tax=Paxillus involutus ATCC 200175 TaxID=664439 RepID=A0A0C9T2Z2_PAXIN|nr:hypothetical protein PAXINDRAFT_20897 [Paxillus involutus ATCC 200175]